MVDAKNITEEMPQFAIESLNVTKTKPVLYIASDSNELVWKIVEHFPFRSFTAPGPILHMDRWSADDDLCAGFLKVIIEFYPLGECRTSLISNSGVSAFICTERWRNESLRVTIFSPSLDGNQLKPSIAKCFVRRENFHNAMRLDDKRREDVSFECSSAIRSD